MHTQTQTNSISKPQITEGESASVSKAYQTTHTVCTVGNQNKMSINNYAINEITG